MDKKNLRIVGGLVMARMAYMIGERIAAQHCSEQEQQEVKAAHDAFSKMSARQRKKLRKAAKREHRN